MKKTILFFAGLCMLAACKKSDNNQYSTWHIIGKGDFSTNKVIIYPPVKNDYTMQFLTNDASSASAFEFTFPMYYNSTLPQSGNYLLVPNATAIKQVNLSFGYNNIGYYPAVNSGKYIKAESYNGKAKLVLDTTWFYNWADANDSVQIYGTFLEP
jgi:hypothetical protein